MELCRSHSGATGSDAFKLWKVKVAQASNRASWLHSSEGVEDRFPHLLLNHTPLWCFSFPPLHRAAQIDLLQLLVGIAAENNLGIAIDVKIKFNIVASLYDYNPNLATYMKV